MGTLDAPIQNLQFVSNSLHSSKPYNSFQIVIYLTTTNPTKICYRLNFRRISFKSKFYLKYVSLNYEWGRTKRNIILRYVFACFRKIHVNLRLGKHRTDMFQAMNCDLSIYHQHCTITVIK